MILEQKYFIALSELENTYIEHTKGSVAHKVLRNDIQSYVQFLEKQLQQKEDIINKAKVDLEKHLNAKSYDNHKYELFDREYLEEVLEILNSKGEQK